MCYTKEKCYYTHVKTPLSYRMKRVCLSWWRGRNSSPRVATVIWSFTPKAIGEPKSRVTSFGNLLRLHEQKYCAQFFAFMVIKCSGYFLCAQVQLNLLSTSFRLWSSHPKKRPFSSLETQGQIVGTTTNSKRAETNATSQRTLARALSDFVPVHTIYPWVSDDALLSSIWSYCRLDKWPKMTI